MCRKLTLIVSLVVMLCLVGQASAIERDWVGGTDSENWCHEDNWSPVGIPEPNDSLDSSGSALPGPIIGSGCDANIAPNGNIELPSGNQHMVIDGGTFTCREWYWGREDDDDGTDNPTITMSGGAVVTAYQQVRWGNHGDANGTINITDGTSFYCGSQLKQGDDGSGVLNISGSTTDVNVGALLLRCGNTGSKATFTMTGGLLYVRGGISLGFNNTDPYAIKIFFDGGYINSGGFGTDGSVPFTMEFGENAVLEIRNDNQSTVDDMEEYIALGYITGSGILGDPLVITARGSTFVGYDFSQTEAFNPYPPTSTGGICPENGLTLTWEAGDTAEEHEIFFGTSWDDVNEMTDPCQTNIVGNETFETGWLEYGQGYYWRIDEIKLSGDPCTWRGSIWSFGTPSGQASNLYPPDNRRGMMPGDYDLSWTLPCFLTGQTLYYGTDVLESVVLFEDDFETNVFDNWSVTTDWTINEYDPCDDDSNFAPRDDDNNSVAIATRETTATLTSVDIDTSDYANSIHVSFSILLDKGVGLGDVNLGYYNGSGYVEVADWNENDPCNTWINYNHTITDSQYLIPNFSLQLVSTLAGPNTVAVDDFKVRNTWPVFPEWVETEFGPSDNNYPVTVGQFENYGWRLDINDGNNIIQGQYWDFTTSYGGLLMYYKFDGSGAFPSPITDDSGNNIQFTKYDGGGSLTYGSSNPVINSGSGASADFEPNVALYRLDPCGPSERTRDLLRLNGDYTVEMWVYPRSLSTEENSKVWLISKRDAWGLVMHGHNNFNYRGEWGFGGSTDDYSVELNEWTHLAVVMAQNDPEEELSNIYLNGEDAGDAYGMPPADNNNPVWIGVHELADGNFTGHFDGMIDEIRIHDIAFGSCALLHELRDPEYPKCPFPEANDVEIDPCGVVLTWMPGESATSHRVYFSSDEADVQNLEAAAIRGPFNYPMSDSQDLAYGTTYYWRVVELPGNEIGEVWKFTTEYNIVDITLLLHYPFDETSDDTAYDASGHGNHGDVDFDDDDEGWDPTDARFGGSLLFDDDTNVDADGDVFESLNGGVSISLWLKNAYKADANNWVFDCGYSPNRIQAAVVDSSQNVLWRAGEDPCDVLRWNLGNQNPATLQGWHHWVFIKNEDTGELSLYFDTELVKTKTGLPNTLSILSIGSFDLRIGAFSGNDGDLVAKMDDFRVYDYVIDGTKVIELYRGSDLNIAWAPNPGDGATDIGQDVVLSWKPGDGAIHHDVYVGNTYAEVVDANTNTAGIYRVRLADIPDNNYPLPASLSLGSIRYWRIDEVTNDPCLWKGNVWKFTVANYLVVDDFESYISYGTENPIHSTWQNDFDTGAWVELGFEPLPVHRGDQSMEYGYDSDYPDAEKYSENYRNYANAQNWEEADVKLLTLFFYGHPDNDANSTEQMYFGIQDSNGTESYSEVRYGDYGEDMNDIRLAEWQEWNIELSDFNATLTDVRKLFLGFGDREAPSAGGEGYVYFDDIRLYPPKCVPSEGPDYDFSGDCVVGFAEIAMLGDEWLLSAINLGTVTPPSSSVLHYEFSETSGTMVADSANGYTGAIFDDVNQTSASISGHTDAGGVSGNSFHFWHGDEDSNLVGIEIPPEVFTDNGISQEISISMWIKNVNTGDDPDGDAYMLEFRDWNGSPPDTNQYSNERVLAIQATGYGDTYTLHDNSENVSYDQEWDDITEWTHYAFVRDAANLKIYVNGFQEEIGASSGTPMVDPNLLYLGLSADRTPDNENGLHDGFTGNMDDFIIFNYALSDAEAGHLGTNGLGYIPMPPATMELIYDEPLSERAVNFRDYAELMLHWLEEELWPL